MVNRIRKCIAGQIETYCDLNDWLSVRQGYFVYSYVTFLTLAANKIRRCHTLSDVLGVAKEIDLENQEVLDYVKGFRGTEELVKWLSLSDTDMLISLNELYQAFLANDFVVDDSKQIIFSKGKNGRDVLGAYYTSDRFAYEITQKALKDYVDKNKKDLNAITVIDNSCGAGEFLLSMMQNICEMGDKIDYEQMERNMYGYDVDPIAVIIARLRIMLAAKQNKVRSHIILGNPLIITDKNTSILEKFLSVASGRFYSEVMTIGETLGTYDIIVGNPPWEKVRFEEKKFLKHYYADESRVESRENRKQLLEQCGMQNRTYFETLESDYVSFKKRIKKSGIFSQTSCGEINTYALFTELSMSMMKEHTVVGLIVKASLLKMPVYKTFMEYLTGKKCLYDVFMFVNRNKIFHIDSREEFSVIYMRDQEEGNIRIAFNMDKFENMDSAKRISMTPEILRMLNPETGMIPTVKHQEDLNFLIHIYENNPTFGEVYSDVRYGRLVHFTNHANVIKRDAGERYIPVYEGKFIEQYNSKYATFYGMSETDKYRSKASAVEITPDMEEQYPEARYFIEPKFWNGLSKNFTQDYILVWRSLTSVSNRRTMIATVLPKMPTSQSLQIMQSDSKTDLLNILALFNSIVFDDIVRKKMVGLDLTQTIVKQMPVPTRNRFLEHIWFEGQEASVQKHIHSRIRAMYINDSRMNPFFVDIDTYPILPSISAKQLVCEIDQLIGYLYGLDATEIKEIAQTFTKFYDKKELEEWF